MKQGRRTELSKQSKAREVGGTTTNSSKMNLSTKKFSSK
jgi:hypothetical protein